MRTNEVDMLSGSITKGLLMICTPVMMMNVVQSLFNIMDMTVLKTFDADGLAVGAVGVCNTLISLITNLVLGIATGANVIIAHYIGQKDPLHTGRAVGTSIALSGVAGFALAAAGISCAEIFLGWINCPPTLFPRAVLYFRMYFAGVPILMIYNFAISILRATGNTQKIMTISIVGGIIKAIATLLMVAIFQKGIIGVALSTILSWIVNALWALSTLFRDSGAVKLYRQHIRFYRPELPRILRIGIPSGLQLGLYSVANVVISTAVNSFGPDAATGISIADTYDGLLYYICNAASLAVMPYISQNIGAGNVRRAGQAVGRAVLITVSIGAFFGTMSALFSGTLASIMSDDPAVIAYAQQKMRIVSSTYFICGINDIFSAALRGMGKPGFPTGTTLIFMCALRVIWVQYVFPLMPNLTFLYLVWPIGWVTCILCALAVYFPSKRALTEKYEKSKP